MKRAALALLLFTLPMFSASFRAHLVGSTLDVYVGSSTTEQASDIPGAPAPDNKLIVSVKSSDDSAQAVMVWVMVRLDDQTRTTRSAVMRCDGGLLVFEFSLGVRRPIELVDIRVDNLRKVFADALAVSY